MNINLNNLTALVCGSSDGIGKAIAIEFAKSGANVVLLSKSKDKLIKVLNELPAREGQKHNFIVADMANIDELQELVKNFIEKISCIDILINNTGGPAPGPIVNAKIEDLDKAFTQHIKSAHILTQLLLPNMMGKKFGRIINIVSIGLKEPIKELGISNTIRGAIGSWAKTLSKEIAKYGITVNNILPGYTATQRLIELFKNNANKLNVSLEEYSNTTLNKIPSGRFAEPAEIGYLSVFLASNYANYINGTSIPIDGGYLSSI